MPYIRRDLIRLPGAVTCSLGSAGGAETTSVRLASGYGPSKPLAELLDAAPTGLIS